MNFRDLSNTQNSKSGGSASIGGFGNVYYNKKPFKTPFIIMGVIGVVYIAFKMFKGGK